MLALILPSPGNNYRPPVSSISRLRPNARRGIRLVEWVSLETYIRFHGAGRRASKIQERNIAA